MTSGLFTIGEPQGWKCPGCGACYAPWWYKCDTCPPKVETFVATEISTEGTWQLCTAHGRMHPPDKKCPVCAGEATV